MRYVMCLIAVFALTLLCVRADATQPSDFQQWDLDIGNNGSIEMHGLLYVPTTYNPANQYSVVTYLHGAGHSSQQGIDIHGSSTQTDNMLAQAEAKGFILFLPQAPTNAWTSERTGHVAQLVDRIASTYNVDTNRLYMTGGSMGGGGVYTALTNSPGKYAAAIPMAGVSPSGVNNTTLSQTPMWIWHGASDGTVNVSNSRNRTNAILGIKGEPTLTFPPTYTPGSWSYHFVNSDDTLRYSEFQYWGHAIWPDVMNRNDVYAWLFSNALPEPTSLGLLLVGGVALLRRRARA